MKEEKRNRSPSVTVMLASFILIAVFLLILFIERRHLEENITPKESIRLSTLSPVIITETENELNKRLRDSGIESLFYKASIQGDKIYVFLDQNRWRGLSLNEKADVLLQVAQICRVVGNSVGIPIEPDKAKPGIYFYSRDSNKELASWDEQGGIIMN